MDTAFTANRRGSGKPPRGPKVLAHPLPSATAHGGSRPIRHPRRLRHDKRAETNSRVLLQGTRRRSSPILVGNTRLRPRDPVVKTSIVPRTVVGPPYAPNEVVSAPPERPRAMRLARPPTEEPLQPPPCRRGNRVAPQARPLLSAKMEGRSFTGEAAVASPSPPNSILVHTKKARTACTA